MKILLAAVAFVAVVLYKSHRNSIGDFPLTRQSTSYNCGPAVIQSVLAYYGINYREDELAKALGTTEKVGTSSSSIIGLFINLGLSVDARQMTIDDLRHAVDNKIPTILCIQAWPYTEGKLINDHYVVLVGYDKNIFTFEDPSLLGVLGYLTEDELLKRWNSSDDGKCFGIAVSGFVSGSDGSVYNKNVLTHINGLY